MNDPKSPKFPNRKTPKVVPLESHRPSVGHSVPRPFPGAKLADVLGSAAQGLFSNPGLLGMSVPDRRDLFASSALVGLLMNPGYNAGSGLQRIPQMAREIADQLISELDRTKEDPKRFPPPGGGAFG
jgi:hypothetical protein